jgi:hypothetical protein
LSQKGKSYNFLRLFFTSHQVKVLLLLKVKDPIFFFLLTNFALETKEQYNPQGKRKQKVVLSHYKKQGEKKKERK